MDNELRSALSKAKGFLLSSQNHEGYWSKGSDPEYNGPDHLQKPIVITSQVIDALIYLGLEDTSPISKGLFYCFKEKVEDSDAIEILALKLKALSYSNVPYIQKKAKQLLKVILSRQSKDGYWPTFPKTSNLTNFIVSQYIYGYETKDALNKLHSWLVSHKSKDGIAWGLNDDSEKSEVSFTTNVGISILNAGEGINSKTMQDIRKFLESKQMKDGGWPSSDLTYPKESTIYATSIVCYILLKIIGDINNKQIISGINFLIDSQLDNGSWPLTKNGKAEYFTTCYAAKTLTYYSFLKSKLEEENIKSLLKNVKEKNLVINFLMNDFDNKTRNDFLNSCYNLMIDKILATTSSAVKRRKIIISIMENEGEVDTADIIDHLKKIDGYRGLHKRSHLAQIKNDMDALVNLGLIEENKRKYFLVRKV